MDLLNRVKSFLSSANYFMDLAMVEKGKLFLGYQSREKWLNTKGYCFGDYFLDAIEKGYGFIIVKGGRVSRFGDKGQESRVEDLQNSAIFSTFFNGLDEIISN